MSAQPGHYLRSCAARKIMWDLLDSSRLIPLAAVERTIHVRDLVQARACAQPRPSWNSIFTKAYARVAAEMPELRQTYTGWPWGRIYQCPHNLAIIAVEAVIDNERVIVQGRVPCPENFAVQALDRHVASFKDHPTQSKWFRRGLTLARWPRPVRRLLWWLALEWSGRQRAKILGTFGVTSVAFAGADAATVVTPIANVLHYGLIDPTGNVRVGIVFDHRIMDGAQPARALARLEQVLNTDILGEVRSLHANAA